MINVDEGKKTTQEKYAFTLAIYTGSCVTTGDPKIEIIISFIDKVFDSVIYKSGCMDTSSEREKWRFQSEVNRLIEKIEESYKPKSARAFRAKGERP